MKKYGIHGKVKSVDFENEWTHIISISACGGVDLDSFLNEGIFEKIMFYPQVGLIAIRIFQYNEYETIKFAMDNDNWTESNYDFEDYEYSVEATR